MNLYDLISGISVGAFDGKLRLLYGASEKTLLHNKTRFISAAENFSRMFPECDEIHVFSAPGRIEIGGNHTDHQHGCVLAAAVNRDIIAIVSYHDEGIIRLRSEGFPAFDIELCDLEMREDERLTSAAIVRGIAAGFAERGVDIKGFDIFVSSSLPVGGGLASSAAFGVLIAEVIDTYYNNGSSSPAELAKVGQFAENVYFGKNSGLMDNTVCAAGGFLSVDFADPEEPEIIQLSFDFERTGYSVCITDTKGSHAGLVSDYEAVSHEMKRVAKELGCEVLRQADEEEFYAELPRLREACGDRAVLRAAHFFAENTRAIEEAQALSDGDTERFFGLVNESADSSAELLQNLYSCSSPENQQIPLAIMLSRRFLGGIGAVRVHGGGFAGTIEAFVPSYLAGDYAKEMERIFGEKCCHILSVRSVGSYELTLE